MKNLTLIIGAILLVVNILFGLMISAYAPLNVGINCCVIALTVGLVYSLKALRLKDAFIVSFTFLFSVLGIIEFVLGLFAANKLAANWGLILIVIIVAFEIISLFIAKTVSKIE